MKNCFLFAALLSFTLFYGKSICQVHTGGLQLNNPISNAFARMAFVNGVHDSTYDINFVVNFGLPGKGLFKNNVGKLRYKAVSKDRRIATAEIFDSVLIVRPKSNYLYTDISVTGYDTANNDSLTYTFTINMGLTKTDFTAAENKDMIVFQNYPNPFNPATTIKFKLNSEGRVNVEIFNLIGQAVVTLIDGIRPAGLNDVLFDAGELPSGIYIAYIRTEYFTKLLKMNLIK
jgi:hypothetical protein